jgi:hypothetical protein
MKTFIKDTAKMTERELRLELITTRRIIDDIHELTEDSEAGKAESVEGKQNIIFQIAHYCNRKMPR